MSRTIISVEKPQTQTVKAVCALLAWKGRPSNPLPSFVELGSGDSKVVLVLSNKRDAYYTTTARECSCPARSWHPNGPCKHMRKHFAEQQTAKPATIKQPNHGAWHGHNGPVLDEVPHTANVATDMVLPLYVDTTPDANPREVAYWSIQEDKIMLSTLGEA